VLKDDARFCDGCGQRLPGKSKLSQEVVSRAEAVELGVTPENLEGDVIVDLCLDCRVKRGNRIKHGYA